MFYRCELSSNLDPVYWPSNFITGNYYNTFFACCCQLRKKTAEIILENRLASIISCGLYSFTERKGWKNLLVFHQQRGARIVQIHFMRFLLLMIRLKTSLDLQNHSVSFNLVEIIYPCQIALILPNWANKPPSSSHFVHCL